MPKFSRAQVRSMLAMQGFSPPEADLTETTHRINALIEGLTRLEELDVFHVEPWTALPYRGLPERTLKDPPVAPAEDAHTDEIAFMTIAEQSHLIRTKQLSPVELVQRYLDRIDKYDGQLHAFNSVMREEAITAAKAAEAEIADGNYRGPLHGIPVGMKDQWNIKGVANTGGSRAFRDNIAAEDCTIIVRLREAGAIILGTLATHEFHMGGTIEFLGPSPANPWDLTKNPAGSSSGSGSAVAAGLISGSIGGDTGGSIRGPAAMCGISGIRPSWGRVSRRGGFALSWELDAPGPLARSAEDCAIILQAIAGADPADPTASTEPVPDYRKSMTGKISDLRVGVLQELVDQMTDNDGRKLIEAAIEVLRRLGAKVDSLSIPKANQMLGVQAAISDGYAASYHRKELREKYDLLDRNTRCRMLAGTILPTGLQTLARRARVALGMEVLDAFDRFDVLVGATMAGPATAIVTESPVKDQKSAWETAVVRGGASNALSSAGVPAISIPGGLTSKGLPIGFQVAARPMDEATVFRVAHAFQQATEHHKQHPPMTWAQTPSK